MKTNFGFVRVAAAVPTVRVADCAYNVKQVKELITEAVEEGVEVICFPELTVTGYTCADLFFTKQLQQDALTALEQICDFTREKPIIALVGGPLKVDNNLFNCAFVMADGEVMGVVPKINLPNTAEFYEKRWFTSGRAIRLHDGKPRIPTVELWCGQVPFGVDLLFDTGNYTFGIEICEDLWSPLPPSTQLAIQGAELIFNLSSSNCVTGKHAYRRQMIEQQSARVHCAICILSARRLRLLSSQNLLYFKFCFSSSLAVFVYSLSSVAFAASFSVASIASLRPTNLAFVRRMRDSCARCFWLRSYASLFSSASKFS